LLDGGVSVSNFIGVTPLKKLRNLKERRNSAENDGLLTRTE
jgi:hypothetical protein